MLLTAVFPDQLIVDGNNVGVAGYGHSFGQHIAVDGNQMAVSSTGSREIYIYEYDGQDWSFVSFFQVYEQPLGENEYISSLSMSGSRIAIGNKYDSENGEESGAVYVFELQNTDWVQVVKLTASDAAEEALFGTSVALSGDRLLVGSNYDDGAGLASGAVYYFSGQNNQWTEQQKFVAADTNSIDEFGFSLSVDGNLAVIGAPGYNYNGSQTGAAYIFEYSGGSYVQRHRLLGQASAVNSRFGTSVWIDTDQVIVGAAKGYNDLAIQTGSAYIFKYNGSNWDLVEKVFGGRENTKFGSKVFISENRAIISMPGNGRVGQSGAFVFDKNNDDWSLLQWILEPPVTAVAGFQDSIMLGVPSRSGVQPFQGEVSAYRRANNTWFNQQLIVPGNGPDGDYFGFDLSVSQNRMLIGAPGDAATGGDKVGSARIYEKNNNQWSEQDILIASDATVDVGFGERVALDGDYAVVSATGDTTHGADAGAVYFFRNVNNIWSEIEKITPTDATAGDLFGQETALENDTLMVASNTTNETQAGAVYFFEFNGTNWIEQQKLQSGQSSDNFGAEIVLSGDTLFVGAPNNSVTSPGNVYVYERVNGSWVFQNTLPLPTDTTGRHFGRAIAIDSDLMVVASSESKFVTDFLIVRSIYLHVYEKTQSGWVYDKTVRASTRNSSDRDVELAMQGNTLLVNGHGYCSCNDVIYTSDTIAYRVENTDLSYLTRFTNTYFFITDPLKINFPVEIEGDFAYTGLRWDERNGRDAGAVMSYDIAVPDVIFEGTFE